MVPKFSKFSKKKKSLFENAVATVVFVVIFVGMIGFFAFQNISIGNKRTELESQLQELQAQAGQLSLQQQDLQKKWTQEPLR